MSELVICERCGTKTIALAISIAHEAVCMNCLHYLEQPEIKQRVTNHLENHNIRNMKVYIARTRGKG